MWFASTLLWPAFTPYRCWQQYPLLHVVLTVSLAYLCAPFLLQCVHMHATLTAHVARCRDGDNGFKVSWSLRMLTWVQCMQSLLKAMNRDLQGLWIARLAKDPLLVPGLLLPVWCVGAHTRFLRTRCTIPTLNVFAGNLFIRLSIMQHRE